MQTAVRSSEHELASTTLLRWLYSHSYAQSLVRCRSLKLHDGTGLQRKRLPTMIQLRLMTGSPPTSGCAISATHLWSRSRHAGSRHEMCTRHHCRPLYFTSRCRMKPVFAAKSKCDSRRQGEHQVQVHSIGYKILRSSEVGRDGETLGPGLPTVAQKALAWYSKRSGYARALRTSCRHLSRGLHFRSRCFL